MFYDTLLIVLLVEGLVRVNANIKCKSCKYTQSDGYDYAINFYSENGVQMPERKS